MRHSDVFDFKRWKSKWKVENWLSSSRDASHDTDKNKQYVVDAFFQLGVRI